MAYSDDDIYEATNDMVGHAVCLPADSLRLAIFSSSDIHVDNGLNLGAFPDLNDDVIYNSLRHDTNFNLLRR